MQALRANINKVGSVKTNATTIAVGMAEQAGPTTSRATTRATKNTARNHHISRKNASTPNGDMMKSATAVIAKDSGHTGSAHSSNTIGARVWNGSQLPKIARSAPPNHTENYAHRCSRDSDTHHHLNPARHHPSGTRKKSMAEDTKSGTSHDGALRVSPNHRSGGYNGCVAWNKPKKIIFSC